MNNVKFVSFYTENGTYPELIKDLQKSLDKFSLIYEIEKLKDNGSWVKNCALKAEFIKTKLEQAKTNDCIVWIDSDAQIIKYPDFFLTGDQEFMIRGEPGGRSKVPAGRERIHLPVNWPIGVAPCWFNSGTIFIKATAAGIALCNRWLELKNENPTHWDQWTLQQAWCDIQPKTEFLPQSYCQIDRLHGRQGAVILHRLASVEQRVNRQ
jgi:hypothetical protein